MQIITRSLTRGPNRFHHWALLVGNYYHELIRVDTQPEPPGGSRSSGSGNMIWYRTGRRFEVNAWSFNPFGQTDWNDSAIVSAGKFEDIFTCDRHVFLILSEGYSVIRSMPPTYNIFTNNCQHFVERLGRLIASSPSMGGRRFWGLDGLFSMPLPELSEDE
jgi:hypothetical protein